MKIKVLIYLSFILIMLPRLYSQSELNPKLIWTKTYTNVRDVILGIKTNNKTGLIEPYERVYSNWTNLIIYDKNNKLIGEIPLKLKETLTRDDGTKLTIEYWQERYDELNKKIVYSKNQEYIARFIILRNAKIIRYYNNRGELLWRKESKLNQEDYYDIEHISNDGNRIFVKGTIGNKHNAHHSTYFIFNKKGDNIKTFKESKEGQGVEVLENLSFSPNGEYWIFVKSDGYYIGRNDKVINKIDSIRTKAELNQPFVSFDKVDINNNKEVLIWNLNINTIFFYSKNLQLLWEKKIELLKQERINHVELSNDYIMIQTKYQGNNLIRRIITLINKNTGEIITKKQLDDFHYLLYPLDIIDNKYILLTGNILNYKREKVQGEKKGKIINALRTSIIDFDYNIIWEEKAYVPGFEFNRYYGNAQFIHNRKYILIKELFDIGEEESSYKQKNRNITFKFYKLN